MPDSILISKAALIELKKDTDRYLLYRTNYERLFKASSDFANIQLSLIIEAETAQIESMLLKKQYDELFTEVLKSKKRWKMPLLIGIVLGFVTSLLIN